MSRPRALGLLLLALLAAGCRRASARRDVEEALAAQRAIALPKVAGAGLSPPAPGVRVLVGPSAIDVDAVGLFASWPEERRDWLLHALPEEEAAALPFVHRGLVRFAGGRVAMPDTPGPDRPEIRPLADVLVYARELERRYAKMAEEEHLPDAARLQDPAVVVYADAGTPYGILAAVLYTIGWSEYQVTLVARAPGGDVALPPAQPRAGGLPPLARIAWGPDGLVVSLVAPPNYPHDVLVARELGMLDALRGVGQAPPGTLPSLHLGRAILGADRACPSVPLRDGAPDQARLRALLAGMHARLPSLESVQLLPSPDAPWSSVAAVAATALDVGLAGYSPGFARTPVPPLPCSAGVVVDELVPEDLMLRR